MIAHVRVPQVAGGRRLAVAALLASVTLVVGLAAPVGAIHDGDVDDACPPPRLPVAGFGDVAADGTHAAAIDCVTWYGVSEGVRWSRFGPRQPVRRDAMASFVARTLLRSSVELPSNPDDHFDDDDGNVHEHRINQLADIGVVEGRGGRRYEPEQFVSRAATVTLMVRAFEEATGEELTSSDDHFDDDDGSVHEGAINAAAEAGLVRGTGEREFSPHGASTRAQMATLLVRLLDEFAERDLTTPPEGWADDAPPPPLSVELVTDAVDFPVFVTAPAGDDRLFVAERAGRVHIVRDGGVDPTPFLDLRDRTTTDGERGLFAVAFHPDYADNGRVYVHYTDPDGDTRVERFVVAQDDPDRVDPASRTVVLQAAQPYSNHNGGMIQFGPDGMLYVALGDGGSGGDPHGNGQDPSTLLGSILRLDVDVPGAGYRIPDDNPFAGDDRRAPEVWSYGLRNPWRFAFDPATDHLVIADVGQNSREEVNAAPGRAAGVNYGWNVMEGSRCYGSSTCDREGLTAPVYEYGHGEGCSITGGFVYRGDDVPGLRGHYLFGDLCDGWVRSVRYDGGGVDHATTHELGDLGSVYSFGTDADGELYVAADEGVFRLRER